MEQEFEHYKIAIEKLFEESKILILSQEKDVVKRKKTEMTLKIIRAVVIRFVKTILIKKSNIILCTSKKEIIDYVRIGLSQYFLEEDSINKEVIEKNIAKLKIILTEVDSRYNTYGKVI